MEEREKKNEKKRPMKIVATTSFASSRPLERRTLVPKKKREKKEKIPA